MKNQTPVVTVQELIEKLREFPQDAPVKIRGLHYEDSWSEDIVERVEDIDLACIETVPNARSGKAVVIDS